ncbi:hypothetical protein POF51_26330 [Brevibacillus sp. AG]|uniref:hypothetical protein n=1 Tax=Brevibacillus sp. AG TaxID=3020891 RepID=UPI00232F4BFB|nr:hypothetical protein [Brevibacillus sp. AG]MDC0764241.1 hypothetical protein [Brevibacillus sp. AG]
MNNYLGTLLSIFVSLVIAAAFIQIHVVNQIKQEMRELQADAVKKIEAEGNLDPVNAQPLLLSYLEDEIATKNFRLDINKLQIKVRRTEGISDGALTYNDEFTCTLTYEKPNLVSFFQSNRDFVYTMHGTMEPLPYDANP